MYLTVDAVEGIAGCTSASLHSWQTLGLIEVAETVAGFPLWDEWDLLAASVLVAAKGAIGTPWVGQLRGLDVRAEHYQPLWGDGMRLMASGVLLPSGEFGKSIDMTAHFTHVRRELEPFDGEATLR